jgi:hypothetical protein
LELIHDLEFSEQVAQGAGSVLERRRKSQKKRKTPLERQQVMFSSPYACPVVFLVSCGGGGGGVRGASLWRRMGWVVALANT